MKKILLLSAVTFLAVSSHAQLSASSQWTWIKGDNTVNAAGIYGTKGTAAAENKPGAREGSFSWTDAAGNFWLYGGSGSNSFNDLWKYSTATNQWMWVHGNNTQATSPVYGTQGVEDPANSPGSRVSGASWRDAAGNLWLFGGSTSLGYMNDLWKYNPATNAWTWMKGDNTASAGGNYGTKGMANVTNKPGARYSPSAWTDALGNLWLFGGRGYVTTGSPSLTNLNDLWKYNPSTNQWTWTSGANSGNDAGVYGTQGVAASANNPGARFGSTAWLDAAGNFWLFGGELHFPISGMSFCYNDLWKYDPVTNLWAWVKGDNTQNNNSTYGTQGVSDPANKPGGRYLSVPWSDAYGNLWLFGGLFWYGSVGGGTQVRYGDLWKYNIAANQWTWVKGDNVPSGYGVYGTQGVSASANKPGARLSAVSWTDAAGVFWLFGGNGNDANGTGDLNDLWKLSNPIALPLTLLSVSARAVERAVIVNWRTAQEINASHFEIEHSTDGFRFLKAGSATAAGSGSTVTDYSFLHQRPVVGVNYYRIKMVNKDGSFKYSPVVTAVLTAKDNVLVFPNPVVTVATIRLTSAVYANLKLSLYDESGRLVSTKQIPMVAGVNSFTIAMGSLAKGTYTALLAWGQESEIVRITKAE